MHQYMRMADLTLTHTLTSATWHAWQPPPGYCFLHSRVMFCFGVRDAGQPLISAGVGSRAGQGYPLLDLLCRVALLCQGLGQGCGRGGAGYKRVAGVGQRGLHGVAEQLAYHGSAQRAIPRGPESYFHGL